MVEQGCAEVLLSSSSHESALSNAQCTWLVRIILMYRETMATKTACSVLGIVHHILFSGLNSTLDYLDERRLIAIIPLWSLVYKRLQYCDIKIIKGSA